MPPFDSKKIVVATFRCKLAFFTASSAWFTAEGFVGRLRQRPTRLQVGGDGRVVPVGEVGNEVKQAKSHDTPVGGHSGIERERSTRKSFPTSEVFW
jgi:hypothetical protein